MRKINSVILHCSETIEGLDIKAESIKRWHVVCNDWKDIGFHYVIDLDGTIEHGRPEAQIGAHCSGYNDNSIGICYVGGFDNKMLAKDTRTDALKKSLYELVESLINRYDLSIDNVFCHNLFNNDKTCPSFSIEQFKKEYNSYIKNK